VSVQFSLVASLCTCINMDESITCHRMPTSLLNIYGFSKKNCRSHTSWKIRDKSVPEGLTTHCTRRCTNIVKVYILWLAKIWRKVLTVACFSINCASIPLNRPVRSQRKLSVGYGLILTADHLQATVNKLLTCCVLKSTQLPIVRRMENSLRATGWRPIVADWGDGWLRTAGPIIQLRRAMDGRILRWGIISSCQSAANSVIVKSASGHHVSDSAL